MNNLKAFLDTIAVSEIGPALLAVSDNGYNVIVGSTSAHPNLFQSYADHPRVRVQLRPDLASTAAGRYQILARYFDAYRVSLHLPDFGPESQDKIAVQMINECRAHDLVLAGDFDEAIYRCRSRWASLPSAGYNQHENKLVDLRTVFVAAGGQLV